MPRFSLSYFLIAFCAFASAQAPSGVGDSLAPTLIEKSKAVLQSMKAKGADELKVLLADDFRSVGSEGKVHDKADLLASAKDGELKDYLFYEPRVTAIDNNVAMVTYNLAVTRPEGDDGLAPRYQKISDLWLRQGGEWRLKFQQATPLRPVD